MVMNWTEIKDTVGKAAPVLGALLGGPAGGVVGSMIAGALGVDDTPEAVSKALLDPKSFADLQKWAYEHKEKLATIQLDMLRAELSDKANARESHKHSVMPAVITIMMTAIVAALLFALFETALPDANQEVAYMIFGQATALWGASVTYWVGTTRSSAEKTRMK